MRTTHPRDREAIGEWTRAHGTKDQVTELLARLTASTPPATSSRSPTGHALVEHWLTQPQLGKANA